MGVEKAIQADETTATAWINQQLVALGMSKLPSEEIIMNIAQ
ncbi:hypothetical protein [Trichormus azollae]|jgi:hypothetical protein|uniref:Uncharacterized protein n=1 Tax=Nostoc azollae (strain 0708) TaxID=551115 RepID=D7DYL3_NOSA0|nr:hypothetical protein [Trichormus azollae]ADI62836.1 hypothetical protein Aazo_0212 ['Nostoc azollae' 0708]